MQMYRRYVASRVEKRKMHTKVLNEKSSRNSEPEPIPPNADAEAEYALFLPFPTNPPPPSIPTLLMATVPLWLRAVHSVPSGVCVLVMLRRRG